ncbi:unnamed protein product [Camellia sinensis]
MSNHLLLTLLLISLLHTTSSLSQSPAPSPAPSGPPNVIAILKKAGHFNKFIRLLKRTQMDGRIFSLLNSSNHQLTIFAPTDQAFADLPSDTIKSLTYQQRIQLVQFHVLNSLLSYSEFQTVSNPLSTQAGDNSGYHFPLNVTMTENQVNITTGMVNASVSGTVYSDDQLAVYEVDHVLLPLRFYVSPPPAPAPPVKTVEAPAPEVSTDIKASGGVRVIGYGVSGRMWFVVGCVVGVFCFCV